jgi:hypothetical protein
MLTSGQELHDEVKVDRVLEGVVHLDDPRVVRLHLRKEVFAQLSFRLSRNLITGQRDHIGRKFAYWEIVFFGQFFENYGSSSKFWGTFSGFYYFYF